MKKVLILFIVLLMLAACGESAPPPASVPSEASTGEAADLQTSAPSGNSATDVPVNADGFVFSYNSENVYMDENISAVVEKLGDPGDDNIFEAPSCAFNGIDRIFQYPGANIHTYPENGSDFVHTINYMDDSIKTAEGVRLGDNLDAVVAAYGSGYEEDGGYYYYYKGGTYVRFLLKDDMVIAITYGLTEYKEEI
jgi:hypothetical protein